MIEMEIEIQRMERLEKAKDVQAEIDEHDFNDESSTADSSSKIDLNISIESTENLLEKSARRYGRRDCPS